MLEHHNLIIDERNRKSTFFDFDAGGMGWLDYIGVKNPEDLKIRFEQSFRKKPLDLYLQMNATSLDILKKKVGILVNLFSINEFGRFKEIVKRSGMELAENEQQKLFDDIKLRLEILSEMLSNPVVNETNGA